MRAEAGFGWLLVGDRSLPRRTRMQGTSHYAAYLENEDGFEVGLVAHTTHHAPVRVMEP